MLFGHKKSIQTKATHVVREVFHSFSYYSFEKKTSHSYSLCEHVGGTFGGRVN